MDVNKISIRNPLDNNMKAILRRIRISPKKANLIAGMVRGKKVTEALNLLKFTPKKGARILYKVVHSAAANAKNNFKQDIDDLVITKILVTKGPTLKRSLPVSRGRTHPILKRSSHITVEVGVAEKEKGAVKKEKQAAQKEPVSIKTPSEEKPKKDTAKKVKKASREPKVKKKTDK